MIARKPAMVLPRSRLRQLRHARGDDWYHTLLGGLYDDDEGYEWEWDKPDQWIFDLSNARMLPAEHDEGEGTPVYKFPPSLATLVNVRLCHDGTVGLATPAGDGKVELVGCENMGPVIINPNVEEFGSNSRTQSLEAIKQLVNVEQDWLGDGTNSHGKFILHADGTCTGCGNSDPENRWAMTEDDHTITAHFWGITHRIRYDEDMVGHVLEPVRDPPSKCVCPGH